MFDSFKKLMQPEFDEAEARGEARGITKGGEPVWRNSVSV